MNHTATQERGGYALWSLSLLVVVLLHAAAGLVLLWRVPKTQLQIVAPALLIDLAPQPAPSPAPPAAEPAPPEPVAQPELPPPDAPQEPVLEPPPPITPVLAPPEPPPELVLEPPKVPVTPAVPLPVKPPPPAKRPPPPRQVTRTAPNDAPPPVAAPAPAAPAPAAASSAVPSTNWQSLLLAHLKRMMRYPAEAQMRHQQGVATVRFTMSPSGAVLSSSLARSSGYTIIDQAALELLRRAAPLPALPADMPQQPIELVVPLRYELN